MTLPMVTCPLCCRPGFNTSDSLCSALINVTTRKLCCPICNHVVIGLDKFTIHLFSHSLHKYGINNLKDTFEMCIQGNDNMGSVKSIPSPSDFVGSFNPTNIGGHFLKFQSNMNQDSNFKQSEKQDKKNDCNTAPHEVYKSLNIPDAALICFSAENGQLFTISSDNINGMLSNVTINTQNYITNTNITTSTVQTDVMEKVHKRKYSEIFDRENADISIKVNEQETVDNYSNIESVNSWPSTPSVSSETDKQISSNNSEREFESCKDLLTKGDFSTTADDTSEALIRKEDNFCDSLGSEVDSVQSNDEIKKNIIGCDLCPFTFPNKTILAMHKQLVHKKVEVESEKKRKSLLCNLCPRSFSLQSSLMIHRRVAHAGGFGSNDNTSDCKQLPTKPACQVCGKFFKKEIHLTQHMKAHDEKQWQCSICFKTFTTKYFLKKHRRLHTGETPYKCSTCSKSFTFQQSYHKHLLYHNDEKPYCCAQCGRLFKELSTLHNHERIHSGEKPFSCETCDFIFVL